MTLFSASRMRARCARRSVRRGRGVAGLPVEGVDLGNVVHDLMLQQGLSLGMVGPEPEGLSLGVLSPVDQYDARRALANAERLGVWMDVPPGTEVEVRHIGRLDAEGNLTEIDVAPPWATRGETWDPARCPRGVTLFSWQADLGLFRDKSAPNVWRLRDWKTHLGLIKPERLAETPQPITYCAAEALRLGLAPDATVVFEYFNLRFGVMMEASAPAEVWIAEARELWRGCWEQDQIPPGVLEDRPAPSDECGVCEYRRSCRPNTDAALSDVALHHQLTHARIRAKELGKDFTRRMKERSSVLELADGTIMGAHPRRQVRLPLAPRSAGKPDLKRECLQRVATALGSDWLKHFDKKGSGTEWFDGLPPEARAVAAEYVTESERTHYFAQPKALADYMEQEDKDDE